MPSRPIPAVSCEPLDPMAALIACGFPVP